MIPAEWRALPAPNVTCVAMAGARTTGKSIYLGVLKQQLEIFADKYGSVLEMLGDTRAVYDRALGDVIFKDRQILPPTVEISKSFDAHRPLIYRFVDSTGRPQILVLRDVAGEDLEDLRNRRPQLAFVSRADAVIALLDPLKIPELRNVLRGVVPMGELGGDGVEVLQQVLELLQLGKPPGVRIPIAVTLSKVDYLHAAADVAGEVVRSVMVRPGSPLRRDPSMRTPTYDTVDGDLLHHEIDSLLRMVSGNRVDNVLRNAAGVYRYFAVSSLGAASDGQSINTSGIAPFRVLDPVKWILKQ
ncbi:hypothetical protein ncot_11795 [Nocardioides sp. JQ2195]|uniref:hypothetical protein n=1 Tax=Nocardioides sp. JQ2195 TaxID=2592334 RepID=UPI00143EE015|nr:hypothetical protein [Nocardioides sp. JQ2195]QIX27205.1 hypothetical protein ncot_11795 [Nocardioides sp. JQ2195]